VRTQALCPCQVAKKRVSVSERQDGVERSFFVSAGEDEYAEKPCQRVTEQAIIVYSVTGQTTVSTEEVEQCCVPFGMGPRMRKVSLSSQE
jgi:hypothetical protein